MKNFLKNRPKNVTHTEGSCLYVSLVKNSFENTFLIKKTMKNIVKSLAIVAAFVGATSCSETPKAPDTLKSATDAVAKAADSTVAKAGAMKDSAVAKAGATKDSAVAKAGAVKDAAVQKAGAAKDAAVQKAGDKMKAAGDKMEKAGDKMKADADKMKKH